MTGFGSLAMALSGLSAVAAAPALTGLYQVGEVGLVEFSTEGGSVIGRYRGGGSCGFEPDSTVLTGVFEGGVFAGTVVLCQEGPRCPALRSFPILAIYRQPHLIGSVKFEPGCSSRATDARRLLFSPADPEDAPSDRVDEATPRESTAASMAATHAGQQKLEAGDARGARRQFELATQHDETNAQAWMGLGVSQAKLKEHQAALSALLKAEELLRQKKGERTGLLYAQAQYSLACAFAREKRKKEALRALTRAVRLMGAELRDALDDDPDLESIRSEPEFGRLRAELQRGHGRKAK
jgi:hypothetical protein